jgi:hypothetical protein
MGGLHVKHAVSWIALMWPTVSRPIRLGVCHPFGVHDQIFIFPFFCRTIALLFILGRPLWREDGSVICSATRSRGWGVPLVTVPVLLRLLVTTEILSTCRYYDSYLRNTWEIHTEGSHITPPPRGGDWCSGGETYGKTDMAPGVWSFGPWRRWWCQKVLLLVLRWQQVWRECVRSRPRWMFRQVWPCRQTRWWAYRSRGVLAFCLSETRPDRGRCKEARGPDKLRRTDRYRGLHGVVIS